MAYPGSGPVENLRGQPKVYVSAKLRPATAQDDSFLRQVFASTRAEVLGMMAWDGTQQQAFLELQYQAQRRSYLAQFPGADQYIIQREAVDAGRLIVDRSAEALHLVDISLLPEHRNAGLGTVLIRALQVEAAQAGRPVVLHVDQANRARRLYERLEFAQTAGDDIYLEMAWRPSTAQGMTPTVTVPVTQEQR